MGRWQPTDTSDGLQLYEQGKTCESVAELLGFSPETVRRHLHEAGQKFRTSGATKEIEVTEDEFSLGYVVGVMLGDGGLTKYTACLGVIDRDFAEAFRQALDRAFIGLNPTLTVQSNFRMKDGQIFKVYGNSIIVSNFLAKRKHVDWCEQQTLNTKLGILRGLWDSEGSISLNSLKNFYPAIRFSVNDSDLIVLYVTLLREVLGVSANVCGPYQDGQYVAQLCGYEKARRFYEVVKPTIERKRQKFETALGVST